MLYQELKAFANWISNTYPGECLDVYGDDKSCMLEVDIKPNHVEEFNKWSLTHSWFMAGRATKE